MGSEPQQAWRLRRRPRADTTRLIELEIVDPLPRDRPPCHPARVERGCPGAALAPEGVAFPAHLSLVFEQRTIKKLEGAGFEVEVVDYALFRIPAPVMESRAQIEGIEEQCDAHRLRVGDHDVLVAYLPELHDRSDEEGGPPWQ